MIGTCRRFDYLYPFVFAQLSEYITYVLFQPSINCFSPVFGNPHNMIFAFFNRWAVKVNATFAGLNAEGSHSVLRKMEIRGIQTAERSLLGRYRRNAKRKRAHRNRGAEIPIFRPE
jgi:hypothetical protein